MPVGRGEESVSSEGRRASEEKKERSRLAFRSNPFSGIVKLFCNKHIIKMERDSV